MRFIIFASIFFCSTVAFSQEDSHPVMKPGRTVAPAPVKSYADSEEFAKLFKDFYPSIKPAKSVKEQAQVLYQSISRSFTMQGIDSNEASKAAFKNLDENAFEKIYFDNYRRNLSAKELKKYIEFIKTPEGKHIADVWSSLLRVSSEAQMYVARTVNINLTSIRQAAREKMEREHPPENGERHIPPPIQPPHPGSDLFDQGNAGSKDSMMNIQREINKIPPVKIPTDPSSGN